MTAVPDDWFRVRQAAVWIAPIFGITPQELLYSLRLHRYLNETERSCFFPGDGPEAG